jgi:RimJ/RimL family protein N-acetyltransferase
MGEICNIYISGFGFYHHLGNNWLMKQSKLMQLNELNKKDHKFFSEIYGNDALFELLGYTLKSTSIKSMFQKSLEQFTKSCPDFLFYKVTNSHNDKDIGIAGILWNQTCKNTVEMGVLISPKYYGKSYAIKALFLLIEYIFTKKNVGTIVAFCKWDNRAANRVSKGLGFTNLGLIVNKKSCKQYKWQLTKEEYCAKKR